jgi:hypothetical protein
MPSAPRQSSISEFLDGDYTAAAALRDEPGELSPHARRLAERDQAEREERPASSELLAGPGGEAG